MIIDAFVTYLVSMTNLVNAAISTNVSIKSVGHMVLVKTLQDRLLAFVMKVTAYSNYKLYKSCVIQNFRNVLETSQSLIIG